MYGQLKAFKPADKNISTNLEWVLLYFDTNTVEDNKWVSTLLTVIGPSNYGLVRSLVAPELLKDKTFNQLVTVLKKHFQLKPRFYQRSQEPAESVQDYEANLTRLTITCNFGRFLDQALHDHFVCGPKSEQIQKTLLAEDGLTIARAL